ncbi:MAG: glycosyltransferase [Bacteroidales bacterium]|nr:glycosyltransferase [Lachnoclostridium sp.]MCM1385168.1 glycosyltransferase [Lachnoclostridium sp.]MCM1466035.1 glycosyltransferase [Bacteroidales bacterium]
MGRRNLANLKKTIYYLKKNGLRSTWYAVREKLEQEKAAPYVFEGVSKEEWNKQRNWAQKEKAQGRKLPVISIIVPAYRTQEAYLRQLLDSLLQQSYPHWQLVLADATEDDSVERIVAEYRDRDSCRDGDSRICYVHLKENGGISANSNQALAYVTGEFTGLLDHDDILTEDALYEVAARIVTAAQEGTRIGMLYSDEDKCGDIENEYFEPNYKEKFNLDLILGNNYICHFLVTESALLRELKFRQAYDGAQDYDLILRAAERLLPEEERIVYIPKVLYHWRSHALSTAENPFSKEYAYQAGLKAVQDFADRQGWEARAVSLQHPGFYRLEYQKSPFEHRADLAAVGGRVLHRGKIAGGRWTEEGILLYEGLPAFHSGYLHRAMLSQDADAVDIRCIQVREECREIFEKETGVIYKELPDKQIFDISLLPEGTDIKNLSIALGRAFRKAGYRILYLPTMIVEV